MTAQDDIATVTVKPKRRRPTVLALCAAAFVDSSENEQVSRETSRRVIEHIFYFNRGQICNNPFNQIP